ncbi:MAG: LysM peptidoglycan-binding domain-containing protein [Kiloniellales bacterium]|nr:LysM peptidoglycan-binding domain-containing protein [Kiloniellales bacterium]
MAQPALEPAPAVPLFTPEPGLTPRERMKKALGLLQVGASEHARVELNAYLAEVPDSRRAQDLLSQIDADPVEVLGSEHFLYSIRRGDSISSISKKMLGDPLKFHILARYNDLANPSEITVGQVIKVPGKRQVDRPTAQPKTVPLAARKPSQPATAAAVTPQAPEPERATPSPSSDQAGTEAAAAEAASKAAAAEAARKAAAEEAAARAAAAEAAKKAAAEEEAKKAAAAEAAKKAAEAEAAERAAAAEAEKQAAAAEAAAEEAAEAAATEIREQTIKLAILKADSYADSEDFSGAINHLEEGLLEYPDSAELKEKAVVAYVSFADQLDQQGQLNEAESALRRATELAPGDAGASNRLARLERRRQVDSLMAEAARFRNQNLPIEAFQAYGRIVELEPENEAAQQELASLKPIVAEAYHRQALIAFRQEDLAKAVELWDRVLQDVDPEHSQAKLNRAQAIDLMKRLETLSETE